MSTLERAIAIAAAAHAGATDKAGETYILHALRVMLNVGGESERIAAVLHDVVEDTSWTLDRLRAEGFAEEVVRAVDGLTRRDGEDYFDFCRRAGRDPIARAVKLADLQDNLDLSRITNPTTRDHDRLERYREAQRILLELPDRPIHENPRDEVLRRQRHWARTHGLEVDSRGYTDSLKANLFQPLSPVALAGIRRGSGREMVDGEEKAAKVRALHSSSALGLNFFDYWSDTVDRSALNAALDLDARVDRIEFERQFRTGLGGTPPNVDVVLSLDDGSLVAIESKFTEWMTPVKGGRKSFSKVLLS